MAIKRFPRRPFRDTLVLSVPAGFDEYQKPLTPTEYTVYNVHLQACNQTKRTGDRNSYNNEVVLKGKVWVYPLYSTPHYDYIALQAATQAAGGVMTCTVTTKDGSSHGPFTILTVDALPDDEDNLHHFELGLV